MKNDLFGKRFGAYVDGGRFHFPRLEKEICLQKIKGLSFKCEITCVLPLSPIYTVTSFATAKVKRFWKP